MLQSYFAMKNQSELLAFAKSPTIDDAIFHKISNELADFTVDAYGFDGITHDRKRMVTQAAAHLFDGMKFSKSEGSGTVSTHKMNLRHNSWIWTHKIPLANQQS